ncbi:MAG TPA: M20/M25/M40 family metallo-hydrolase, partial [Rhizomicrobium sp.]|nr:M20/M25/M40 family metallo-hydrolase [Rhizomicrobium sp.]
MLVRTLAVRPADVPPPAPAIYINGMSVARHLAEAVRFETVSYPRGAHQAEKDEALGALGQWLAATYPKFQAAAKREAIGRSLLYTWQGSDPALKPVLLMAHMDVVPVVPGTEKDWVHPPFSGAIDGGYVWGRGAIDDKGALVAIMEAMERLAASGFTPKRTVMIALGADELTGGMKGDALIAKTLATRGTHFEFVLGGGDAIVEEPFPGLLTPIAFLGVAEKGYLSLELVAHGEGGQSARPTRDMAIARLASAITKVMHRPFRSDIGEIEYAQLHALAPVMAFAPRMLVANLWIAKPALIRFLETQPESAARLTTTIAPTMLMAGVKDNVLPPVARAIVNFRLNPRDSIDDVVEHVRRAIDDPKVDIDVLAHGSDGDLKASDMNGPAYKFLAGEIATSFGVPVVPDRA